MALAKYIWEKWYGNVNKGNSKSSQYQFLIFILYIYYVMWHQVDKHNLLFIFFNEKGFR